MTPGQRATGHGGVGWVDGARGGDLPTPAKGAIGGAAAGLGLATEMERFIAALADDEDADACALLRRIEAARAAGGVPWRTP